MSSITAHGLLVPPGSIVLPARSRRLDVFFRLAYRIAFPLVRVLWRIRRKPHEGALVVIRVDGSVLLLESSYRRELNCPGGGVKPGETPQEAARRELQEELGLSGLLMSPAGKVVGTSDGRPDTVHFFEAHLDHLPTLDLDNREITGAYLIPEDKLPTVAMTGPVAKFLLEHAIA